MNRSRIWALLLCALVALMALHVACCDERDCLCCAAIKALSVAFCLLRAFYRGDLYRAIAARPRSERPFSAAETPVRLKTLLLN